MATRKKPGIGQKRKTRQPFTIDKLPDLWRQKVIALRAEWKTWEQISEASIGWEWSELAPEVRVLFRDEKLAPTTLARWYDVQVDQKLVEVAAEAESSRAIAKVFAGKNFEQLDESVVNALADQAFAIVKSADPKNRAKLTGELTALGLSLSRIQRTQIARERLKLEAKKLELERNKFEQLQTKVDEATNEIAKKLGQGKVPTVADIDSIRQRTFGLPPVQRSVASCNPA